MDTSGDTGTSMTPETKIGDSDCGSGTPTIHAAVPLRKCGKCGEVLGHCRPTCPTKCAGHEWRDDECKWCGATKAEAYEKPYGTENHTTDELLPPDMRRQLEAMARFGGGPMYFEQADCDAVNAALTALAAYEAETRALRALLAAFAKSAQRSQQAGEVAPKTPTK